MAAENAQVLWETPLQVGEAHVWPGQPPLSRPSDQNDNLPM